MINVPSWGMVPVTAMVFLISCLFSKFSLDARPPLESELSLPVLRGTVSRMWRPVFGTSVFCFMSGLMMQISGQQQLPLATVQQTSILSSAAVVAVLLVPVLVVKRALHMERLFKLALPLSAAGFLLLPILWNAAGGIVNAFAQLGSMVAGLILWCLLADVARDTQLPSALVFSAALACIDAAQLFGVLVGFVFADNLTQDSIALATIALVSLYLLSMLSLFVFKDREGDFDEIDSEGRPLGQKTSLLGDGTLADERRRACRVNEAADEFALTTREKEVLSLLAQGRTVRGISERLYVSENTVKYHIKGIYQKMGVHTRSELIDRLDKS